jgi:peptidoglycan/LPS O-acetylase OafA/YrhL
LIQDFRYRPEVDGLRALAVLAVVCFHAGLGVPGGFIGVDVFFVVSGYLITSFIVKDLQEGKFTISNFWERRARRILPALVVMVIAIQVAGWFVLLPDDYRNLGKSALYQAAFAANIHFWRGIPYFLGGAEEKPLLHTWSLALEEQFYLFVPLILSALWRFAPLRQRSVLLGIFAAGIVLSLLGAVYGVVLKPFATFYLLPTRAWELLFGCSVALLPPPALGRFLRELLSWGSLVAILVPCWLYSKATRFPGLAALPPCLGTALFLWSSRLPRFDKCPPTCAQVLAMRPLVFIGLISYSLYLWHWPIFAFSSYRALEPRPLACRLGFVGLGFILAVVSWRFVETPFRKRSLCTTKRSMFFLSGVGIATAFTLGLITILQDGFRHRLPARALAAAAAKDDMVYLPELKTSQLEAGELVPIGKKDPTAPIWGLVWGDSFGLAATPAFDQFMANHGLAGRQVWHGATAPLLGFYGVNGYGMGKEAIPFGNALLAYIKEHHIPNVFLVAAWDIYGRPDQHKNMDFGQALINTVVNLSDAGAQPWIMLEVPVQPVDVPRLLARVRSEYFDYCKFLSRPSLFNGIDGQGSDLIDRVSAAGSKIIDPRPCFLDGSGAHYVIERDGIILYRDKAHLTTSGAKLMLVPLLEKTLTSVSSGGSVGR